jgi:hypothetical protein
VSVKILVYDKRTGYAWVREFDRERPPTHDELPDRAHDLATLPRSVASTLVEAVRAARTEGHDVRWWSAAEHWAPLSTEQIR